MQALKQARQLHMHLKEGHLPAFVPGSTEYDQIVGELRRLEGIIGYIIKNNTYIKRSEEYELLRSVRWDPFYPWLPGAQARREAHRLVRVAANEKQ